MQNPEETLHQKCINLYTVHTKCSHCTLRKLKTILSSSLSSRSKHSLLYWTSYQLMKFACFTDLCLNNSAN